MYNQSLKNNYFIPLGVIFWVEYVLCYYVFVFIGRVFLDHHFVFFCYRRQTQSFPLDSITLHTIRLVQYAKKIRGMIQNIQQQIENMVIQLE